MLTTLPPSCAVVVKSGNLNFLELSGPVQACNGTTFLQWLVFPTDGIGCTAVLQSPTNSETVKISHAAKPAVGIAGSDPMIGALDLHRASQD